MKIFEWRKKNYYQRVLLVLTIVAVIVFASHPELRLLLPLLDSLGLDLLLLLIGSQFLDYLKPMLYWLHQHVVMPITIRLYSLILLFLGIASPALEARVTVFSHTRNTIT